MSRPVQRCEPLRGLGRRDRRLTMNRGPRGKSWILVTVLLTGVLAATAQQAPPPPAPRQPGAEISPGEQPEIQSSPQSDPVLAECLALIQKRRYADAAGKIQVYLRDHPESSTGHFLLGYTLYREDQPRESLAEYTAGARLHKPDANDLAVVAMDYVLLADYADADKWLTMATAWAPGDELYWYYLGRTKYAENRFQEAIAAFNRCLTLVPHDLRAEYNLGLAFAGMGRNDAAAEAFRTAIAWERASAIQDPQPFLDFGTLLLQEDKPQQALPLLQQAVAIAPQNPRAREQLGQAWEQLQKLPMADKEMQAAVSLAPQISSLHYELGRIYQREGLTAKAKAEFDRCAALNASHSTDSAETPNPAPLSERPHQ